MNPSDLLMLILYPSLPRFESTAVNLDSNKNDMVSFLSNASSWYVNDLRFVSKHSTFQYVLRANTMNVYSLIGKAAP